MRGRGGAAALVTALLAIGCARPSPRAALAASPSPASLLASMTLAEKVGQLFMVPGNGIFLNDASPGMQAYRHQVVDNAVGGIVWFRSDVYETAVLNAKLQAIAKVPLLVAADLEAGAGMRFDDVTYGPWPMAVAATGDPSLAERRGRATAEEARALGITQVYAPVADVNVNPDNPVINVRSFGEDPAEVARFVAAAVRGLEGGGVLSTLKHFPGHGDAALDSHCSLPTLRADAALRAEERLGLPASTVGRERLESIELVPFRAGLDAGAGAVMTAHISVPALDPSAAPPLRAGVTSSDCAAGSVEQSATATTPASLSAPIVTGLLRGELAFRGLIVTDAMRMGGIVVHYEPGEAAVRALLAGNDQVLLSADTDAAIAAVVKAVRDGRIPESRIDESVARVLRVKERLGLFRLRTPPFEEIARVVGSREHEAVEEEIARRALTLVREEAGVLTLRGRRLVHVAVTDEATLLGPSGPLVADLTRRLGAPQRTSTIDPRSTAEEIRTAIAGAADADVILLTLWVRTRSGTGQIAMPPSGRAAVERLLSLGKPVVAVSFGNPYILRELPALKTYVCAYGVQEVVQLAALRALFGETGFSGRLPVTIPGLAPRGAGIQRAAAPAPAR